MSMRTMVTYDFVGAGKQVMSLSTEAVQAVL